MSSFLSCEIDDAIQYINLGYGAQAPKVVILQSIFSSSCVVFKFQVIFLVLASFSCHFSRFTSFSSNFFQVLLDFPVIYSSFLSHFFKFY